MSRVLVVDDEESIAWGLARLAREEGYESATAASAEQAFALVEKQPCDLIFLDVRLPGMDGLSALPRLTCGEGAPRVVVITAFGDLETAVRAYSEGAFDYLVKPFDLDAVTRVMRRALRQGRRDSERAQTIDAESGPFLGRSPAMQEVFKRIAVVAPADCAVLITGESGTGKELTAQAVHRHSARRERPLVPIHLAALSPTVVESELFGHQRGAYTGAEAAKVGLLELADQGTVFFDEIGDVPLDIQVKLLRAIEQQEVIPVGGTEPRRTNFRVIAATNRDLRQEIQAGQFRADLFFRLAAFEVELPPLRERDDDIDLLTDHFLRAAQSSGQPLWFASSARALLRSYHWPGNVRQLRNVVQSAALLAREGEITSDHIPLACSTTDMPTEERDLALAVEQWARKRLEEQRQFPGLYEEFLTAVEKPLFDVVLQSTAQNRAAAAEILGIHRATLRKKLS